MDETDEIFLVFCLCVYFLHWTEKNADCKTTTIQLYLQNRYNNPDLKKK